jgi:hypothetical protein
MRERRHLAGAALAAVLAAGVGADIDGDLSGGDDNVAAPEDGLAPAAFRAPLRTPPRWTTARLRRAVVLRARPGGRALAELRTRTEFGSARVLSVVRRRGAWLGVHAPELPNGRLGWVQAAGMQLGSTALSVHVDRSRRELELRHGARVVRRLRVGIGRTGSPTPVGRFAVTDKLRMGAGSIYGCCAIALTGRQPDLPAGWRGGDRLAIHGTQRPASIGDDRSLGCIEADESGLRLLMRRLALGTPVFVEP